MVVLILERVSVGLRGELTRWMLEPKAGVFVGSVSGMVRDLLWQKVCTESRGGGCIMVHTCNREQSFAIRMHGNLRRQVEDFEGLFLIRVP
jgi:CRISPR-associated protein Cas2